MKCKFYEDENMGTYDIKEYEKYYIKFIKSGKPITTSNFRDFIKNDLCISPCPSKTWFTKHWSKNFDSINRLRYIRRQYKHLYPCDLSYENWELDDLVSKYLSDVKQYKQPDMHHSLWYEIQHRIKDGEVNNQLQLKLKQYNKVYKKYWKYYIYSDLYDSEKYRFLWFHVGAMDWDKIWNKQNRPCFADNDKEYILKQRRLLVLFTLDQLQDYVEDSNVLPERNRIWSSDTGHATQYYIKNIEHLSANNLLLPSEHEKYDWLVALYKNKKSKGEQIIIRYLRKNGWKTESEFGFDDLRDVNKLRFDVKATKNNQWFLIEYDGRQHFESVDYFGGEDHFKKTVEHDKMKNDYCLKNNISLLRIRYDEKVEEKLGKYLKSIDA